MRKIPAALPALLVAAAALSMPVAALETYPSCESITSSEQPTQGHYVAARVLPNSQSVQFSAYQETNGLQGLQTQKCQDLAGTVWPADKRIADIGAGNCSATSLPVCYLKCGFALGNDMVAFDVDFIAGLLAPHAVPLMGQECYSAIWSIARG